MTLGVKWSQVQILSARPRSEAILISNDTTVTGLTSGHCGYGVRDVAVHVEEVQLAGCA